MIKNKDYQAHRVKRVIVWIGVNIHGGAKLDDWVESTEIRIGLLL